MNYESLIISPNDKLNFSERPAALFLRSSLYAVSIAHVAHMKLRAALSAFRSALNLSKFGSIM